LILEIDVQISEEEKTPHKQLTTLN